MTHLTRLSLANRLIVGLVTLGIFVFGVLATLSLKQELLPSTQVPTAIVTASYPGATPQIVAKDVSTPIERSITGVSGVTTVQSSSTNGQAVITVQWAYGLDNDKLVSNITNAVDSLSSTLPSTLKTDVIRGSTDDIPVLALAVASDASLDQTGRLVQDVAVPEISGISGVRQVSVTGEDTQNLTVTLRPGDLHKHDVGVQAVTATVQAQVTVTPAGTSYDKNTELAVEVGNSVNDLTTFKAMSVATPKGPVPLSALADVQVKSVESTSIARSDGRPALGISVLKETDGDSVQISHDVNALVPELEQKIGHHATFNTVFNQAPLIEQSIHDLAVEGALGLVFAVLVILVFLLSVRSTLITAISIPLSLLIAMIGLQVGNYSLNIFTLAALTVAVGRVVDDSIVVLENIKRRDRGHTALTPADILASVKEVSGAVTASTLTTVAVFLPVAVVSGVVGELFRPFAVTVAVALTASLLVAMGIVPVLAYWFLRGGHRAAATASGAARESFDAPVTHTVEETKVTRLQRGYLPVLGWGLRHPVMTLALAVVIFVGTLGATTLLRTDFLGSVTDQSTLSIEQKLPAGTRLSATSDAAAKTEKYLAADPQVTSYLTTIGGSQIPGVPGAANVANITVKLAEGAKADEVRPQLQQQLDESVTGAGEITVTAANNGATNNDLTVTVKGDNTDDLRSGAERVTQDLKGVPGLTNVRSDLGEQRKVLKVAVDRKKAAAFGFTQADVGQAVTSALRGTPAGSVTLQGDERDIVVYSQSAVDPSPSDVANLELPVSQLQQTNAQKKASDDLAGKQTALSDQQQALTDAQQRKADQAAADQMNSLQQQRSKLQASRSSAEQQLAAAKTQLGQTSAALSKLKASPPQPAPPNPAATPIPVTTEMLAEQQRQQEWAQQVAQLTARAAQTAAGVQQAQAGLATIDQSLQQADKQLSSAASSQQDSAEQRAAAQQLQDEQKALTEEQKALPDVRATAVRVKDVATVKEMLAPTTVTQIKGTPSVTITATPSGTDLGTVTKTVSTHIDAMRDQLPSGITVAIGGSAQDQRDAFNQLGLAMLVAIALVFMIMVGTFRSLLQPLILMVSIPFAATGAVAGLLITGTPLGVPAMVGLLMLIGIVVTNAIVLIDLINQYRRRGEDLHTAITDGARLRLRPIIMTACATIFALIPMGLGLTGGGAFISQPLAVVVIGGLVSSTILTLLLVPVLYSLVERRSERRRLRARSPGPDEPTAVDPAPAAS
jgi:multidrug efflux pump subunit AcrB